MSDARNDALAALIAEPAATALLTDFDGTLAEIVADAESAVALPGVNESLHRLSQRLGRVAIVSGRPAEFLLSRIGDPGAIALYGLYGLEKVQPDGSVATTRQIPFDRSRLPEIVRALNEGLPGAVIEEKDASVAVHWRAHPEDEAALRRLASIAAMENGMVLREAKMSLELLPPGAPDKGAVVRELAATMGCAAFIGDDRGDLAAFDALDLLAEAGLSTLRVAVRSDEAPAALLERADLQCEGPAGVRELLFHLERALDASAPPP